MFAKDCPKDYAKIHYQRDIARLAYAKDYVKKHYPRYSC